MRRRPFRPRRPLARATAGRRRPVPPKLREANRLFENGEYKKAAILFEDLAQKANQRGIPQAPQLYIRSAYAFIKNRDKENGESNLFKGLNMLLEKKKWARLSAFSKRTIKFLNAEGFHDLGKKVEEWVDEKVPENIRESDVWVGQPESAGVAGKLPSNCANCGANVHPKEVEWVESRYVVCAYCGSLLNGND